MKIINKILNKNHKHNLKYYYIKETEYNGMGEYIYTYKISVCKNCPYKDTELYRIDLKEN